MRHNNVHPMSSRWLALLILLSAIAGAPGNAQAAPRFNTERVDGRNYVTLREFIGYYGFSKKWTRSQKNITLSKKGTRLRLKLDSAEARLMRDGQEVRLFLSFPPVEDDGRILIPELDVLKTLDPMLRPWAVPEFKVRTILIDPGHGGFDKGTLGVTRGVMEKTYALDTAKRLERHLRAAGFRTLMTRRTDEYVSLEDRAEQANVSSADLFISVHYNSARPARGPKGIETYCLTPAGAPSTGSSEGRISDYQFNPGNKRDVHNTLLAYSVHRQLMANLDAPDRGIKRARFVVIKEARKPAILIEGGFLSNAAEQSRIRNPAYRETIARSIAQGIVKFAGYVKPAKSGR